MEKPFISVIIICYDRKQFILKALASTLNQTLSKSKYEIIVTKSFKDKKVDDFTSKHHITSVYSPNKKEGYRLSLALKKAKGDVIAFLDDDDEFAKNKLETVYKYFKEDTNLIFYHNNFYLINEADKILHTNQRLLGKRVLIDSEKKKANSLKYIVSEFKANENASSMVLRKKLIENSLFDLKKITVALDAFSFFIALLNTGNVLVDSTPLTFYRVHSIGSVTNGPLATFNKFYMHRKKYTKLAVKDTYILYNICIGTPFQDFVNKLLSETKLYYGLYSGTNGINKYLPSTSDYLIFLSEPNKGKISFVLQVILSKFLKSFVLKLIYKHYIKERMSS